MGTISTLDQVSFDEATKSSTPTLVDFWAEWCGPCKAIAPVLEEVAREQSGKLNIAKLNVDDHPAIARQFGVMSIPTLILFKDGQPVFSVRGLRNKMQLTQELQPHLG